MKNYNFLFVSIILFFSCSSRIDTSSFVANVNSDFRSFSVVLSKAVSNEPELRFFLKNESFKMFDMDNDILVVDVLDRMIDSNRTFRDVLSQYDDHNVLMDIITRNPKINILVPDWRWVSDDCFSGYSWEMDDTQVYVSYENNDGRLPLFLNGCLIQSLEMGQIPCFPVLIVKNNERVWVRINETKSGNLLRFEFGLLDAAYENNTTKLAETILYDVDAATNKISGYAFNGPLAQAYFEASGENNSLRQRDYLYYNMTASCDSGFINYGVSERIYAIRFNNLDSRYIIDEPSLAYDFNTPETNPFSTSIRSFQALSDVFLRSKLWFDGSLDLKFEVTSGTHVEEKTKSCVFSDLFVLKQVKHMVVNGFNVYSVDKNSFVPKWFTVNENLFTWDLSYHPIEYKVKVIEYDDSSTANYSETSSYSFADNISLNLEGTINAGPATFKLGYGTSTNSTLSYSQTVTYTRTDASDDLGSFYVNYNHPYILSEPLPSSRYNTTIYTYSTGTIVAAMIPSIVF